MAERASTTDDDTDGTASGNVPELSVSEVSQAIKRTVEDAFGYVRLRGEVSGYRGPHSSGHCYFALKDEKAKIDAIIWRGVFSKLKFRPEEGLEVIATGRVTTYPGRSSYQIVIDRLEPAGVGALMALLEERRRKLAAEGLFDDDRKRATPYLPEVVGVVTSPTGAVIRDILHRIADRFPVHVMVWPVRVQGDTSGAEVATAVRGFNAFSSGGPMPRPDVLIVARGGGSLEDLWGFNDEAVVRAVAESAIPVVSAVGHETDWTLIDHAADRRAPTPTAAAEFVLPVRADLVMTVRDLDQRRLHAERRLIAGHRTRLQGLARGLPRGEAVLEPMRQALDLAGERLGSGLRALARAKRERLAVLRARGSERTLRQSLNRSRERLGDAGIRTSGGLKRIVRGRRERFALSAARHSTAAIRQGAARSRQVLDGLSARGGRAAAAAMRERRTALASLAKLMDSLGHRSVLARGYALVQDAEGRLIGSAEKARSEGRFAIAFADGSVPARVDEEGEATPAPPPKKVGRGGQKRKSGGPGQGSLF